MSLVAIVPIISVTLSLLSISDITFTSRSMSDVTPYHGVVSVPLLFQLI